MERETNAWPRPMHWSVTKRSQKALGGVGVGVGGKVKDAQHVSPAIRLSTAVNETHNAHALRAPKHEGRYRNGRRRGRHSLLLHRPLIGGWRGVRCPRCRNENFACEAGRAPDVSQSFWARDEAGAAPHCFEKGDRVLSQASQAGGASAATSRLYSTTIENSLS